MRAPKHRLQTLRYQAPNENLPHFFLIHLHILFATAYTSNITSSDNLTDIFNLTDHEGGRWPKGWGGAGGGPSATANIDVITGVLVSPELQLYLSPVLVEYPKLFRLVLGFFLAVVYASIASILVSSTNSTAVDSEKWHCHEGCYHISGGGGLDIVASLFFLTGAAIVFVAGVGRLFN